MNGAKSMFELCFIQVFYLGGLNLYKQFLINFIMADVISYFVND